MSSAQRSLVIGATGQVGAQLVRLLPPEATVTTSRTASGSLQLDLQDIAGNTAEAERLLREFNIGVAYCVGAMTHVDGCEANEAACFRSNCDGPATLAAAATKLGARFVYFSTDYVFDGASGPYAEDVPGSPINVYGRSKWEGEAAVTRACPDALIIRTTGVYGPDDKGKNFLYSLRSVLSSGQPFRVPADQFATPTYNVDLARATLALVQANAFGIFNVAGPDFVSRLEFARQAAVVMGLSPDGIIGLPTAQLGQTAPRPLRAGLKIDKLRSVVPQIRMRGIQEAVSDWVAISLNASAQ